MYTCNHTYRGPLFRISMVGTLTRESLVLVNENTTHLPPLHVRGTRVRFYGKRKRGRGCNKRVEEEEVKEEEKEERKKKKERREKEEKDGKVIIEREPLVAPGACVHLFDHPPVKSSPVSSFLEHRHGPFEEISRET